AVAVDANGRIAHAGFDRYAVDTLVELAGDFFVALAAGLRHFPVIDLGSGIGGGIDAMTAMTTGTGCGLLAERDCAPVNAGLVGSHRMRHGNVVPRQKAGIAVALGAGIREILAGHGRVGFAGGFHSMDGTVTGDAFGGVVIAVFSDLAMNAGGEVLHFVRVTLRALSG